MRKFIVFALFGVCALFAGCNQGDNSTTITEMVGKLLAVEFGENVRTYVEDGVHLRWSADDRITVFYGNSENREYRFLGDTGDYNGFFQPVDDSSYSEENTLGRIYSVYPYKSDVTISNSGAINCTLPAKQTYAQNSFGLGANVMLAVTENMQDTPLSFRNVGGYLKIRLYGDVTISNIVLRGNNDELIAGAATITGSFDGLPSLEMGASATKEITLDCSDGVKIGNSAATATEFWFVVPETTFTKGITITATDTSGNTYEQSTTKVVDIERNVIQPMTAVELKKSAPEPQPITATLTYDECKSIISGYGNLRSYTNSFGTWTICAYDNKNGIQLNKNKAAYVGTPTFEGDITNIKIDFAENYAGDIALCTEGGTTSVVGQFESFSCSGKSGEYTLTTTGHKSFYIRATSGVCRITKITIVAGGSSVNPDPTPEPEPEPEPEPDPTPDPEPDPDPTPGTGTNPSYYAYDWAELPVMIDANKDGRLDRDTNLYYAHHLCAGSEKNAQRNGSARNYTVCYSAEHHCPLWVAAPRHRSYESGASRTDAYGKDPKIPSGIQYNSKSTGGGCNKGHMLGSAERLSSTATNKQVFYYTNIAPQYSDTFNTGGGAWNNLEDHVDGLVCSDTLYVVIGCYFENFSKNGASASPKTISFGGRSDVSCPTMFYYALLRTKKGNTGKRVQDCSASELQCAAFTICHKMAKGHKPEAADMMSIEELEKLTGVTYFPNVKNAPKSSYSPNDWL